ncbi:hypothetical protein RKE29_03215 [Streptomyces sp. B1866]|uniref:hypothetical protein n=1 Tax=Streptomyces sp. B1866 TaxID=3075431 RepID=UPI002890802D|nr:hypothetical protein [Streptomyces sp. B1866]MDT3395667.1 hypothetical protein [Streptomyces sp. B1866]
MSIQGGQPNPYEPPQQQPQTPPPPPQPGAPQPAAPQPVPPQGQAAQPPQPGPQPGADPQFGAQPQPGLGTPPPPGMQPPPGAQPVPVPYAPVPPQQPYPYAQPTMPAMPAVGGYGHPAPPVPTAPLPPGMGPGAGTGPGGGKGWLWAVGGVVVASAVWAGVLVATGGFGGDDSEAVLGSYRYASDLCSRTDLTAFHNVGYQTEPPDSSTDTNPTHSGSEDPAIDVMQCNVEFDPPNSTTSDYSYVYLNTHAELHRESDPGPEFEPGYRAYEDQKFSTYSYTVKEVSGLGDEAFVVTRQDSDSSSSSSSSRYVILGVRDGWVTYETQWSEYRSSSSGSPASDSEATEMLKRSAKETLARLRG